MRNDGIFVIVYSAAESEYFWKVISRIGGNYNFGPSRMIIIELMFGSDSLSGVCCMYMYIVYTLVWLNFSLDLYEVMEAYRFTADFVTQARWIPEWRFI